MNSYPESLSTHLPFIRSEKLENPKDWVRFWEALAAKGASVLLESAGPVHEASRWVILAGDPENECMEKDGRPFFNDGTGWVASDLDIYQFLDGIGSPACKPVSSNTVLNGSGQDWDGSKPGLFPPFPHGLAGAWFGLFSYEFGGRFGLIEAGKMTSKKDRVPDYYFFKPRSIIAYDRLSKEIYYFGEDLGPTHLNEAQSRQPFQVHSLTAQLKLRDYQSMAGRVKSYIEKGDIYQANIAQAFKARWEGNPGSLYRLLKEMNPGPFMGLFQARGFNVVSSSPERLVSGLGDWMETRPIAGTRPRGMDDVLDLQLQWELKTNAKEQAEHLMLVDLARNDLGRVARYGTVEVKSFAEVESYAKVHHLVSVVTARRGNHNRFSEILKSVFPGGTITGCPKVRCMEIIEEIESRPRGYYTGSMGYVAAGPCFDLNILIRSFTLFSDGSLEFCAGAGIVADSDPDKEYMETLYKVEALAQALGSSLLKASS